MADIASSNVTYTLQSRKIGESGERLNRFKVQFGDGALTYPSGGVPLLKASLGVPNYISALKIFDQDDANGFIYKYDFDNAKIRIYQGAGFTPAGTVAAPVFTGSALSTHAHTIPVTAGTAGDAVTNNAGVLESTGGQDLTASSVSAGTPAGTNSAPAFTGSAVAAAALAEVSGALAAVVLYVEVSGY